MDPGIIQRSANLAMKAQQDLLLVHHGIAKGCLLSGTTCIWTFDVRLCGYQTSVTSVRNNWKPYE